jgi:hypothetical protein
MLATLVVSRQTETMRYRYVEVLQGETHDAVNEELLELITRPGVTWLEPTTGQSFGE